MRSLIILEVEHRQDHTDEVQAFVEDARETLDIFGLTLNDYTVRVDLPPCFVLDSGNTDTQE